MDIFETTANKIIRLSHESAKNVIEHLQALERIEVSITYAAFDFYQKQHTEYVNKLKEDVFFVKVLMSQIDYTDVEKLSYFLQRFGLVGHEYSHSDPILMSKNDIPGKLIFYLQDLIVLDFIKEKLSKLDPSAQYSREDQGNFESFHIKLLVDSIDRQDWIISTIYNSLKQGYIAVSEEEFKKHFEPSAMKLKPIQWLGTESEILLFFSILEGNESKSGQKFISTFKIYQIITQHFVNKKGGEFKEDQLRKVKNSTGKKLEDVQVLKALNSKLFN